MPDPSFENPPQPLTYSGSHMPMRPSYFGLGVTNATTSVLFFAGMVYLTFNMSVEYTRLAASAAPLQQKAKQLDAAALAAERLPPHRALTDTEADAAIAYIDTLRNPKTINASHGPISDAQRQTLHRLMTTPGQVVFDPQTTPLVTPKPGRGAVNANLSPNNVLYLDLYQGAYPLDTFRFHGMLNPDGTFKEGPEIIAPAQQYRWEADRLREQANAPDGPGSSVSEAATVLAVSIAELILTIVLFLAAVMLLRNPPRGLYAHRIYALLQLPMCVVLAIVYVSWIDQSAPVVILDILGFIPSAIIGGYTLIMLILLEKIALAHRRQTSRDAA